MSVKVLSDSESLLQSIAQMFGSIEQVPFRIQRIHPSAQLFVFARNVNNDLDLTEFPNKPLL